MHHLAVVQGEVVLVPGRVQDFQDGNGAQRIDRRRAEFQPAHTGAQFRELPIAQRRGRQLQQSGGAPSHFAAALLNVRSGLVPPLNESSLQVMWYEYSTTGQYCPTAGTVWTELDIIQYFQSTTV